MPSLKVLIIIKNEINLMFSKVLIAAASVGLALAQNAGFAGGHKFNNAEFNLRYIPESDEVEFKVTL